MIGQRSLGDSRVDGTKSRQPNAAINWPQGAIAQIIILMAAALVDCDIRHLMQHPSQSSPAISRRHDSLTSFGILIRSESSSSNSGDPVLNGDLANIQLPNVMSTRPKIDFPSCALFQVIAICALSEGVCITLSSQPE